MIDLATHRPSYVPAGRPVRRFVVALVVLAVLFGALWWSGLAAPRLSLGGSADGMYNTATGLGVEHLRLRNDTPVAIEVRRVTAGDERVTFTSVRVNGHDVATSGQKIAGGGATTLDIEYTCRPTNTLRPRLPASTPVRLEITVRTPIGLERTRAAGTVRLMPECLG